MDVPSNSESERQPAADKPGERASAFAHLAFAAVFFLTAVILVSVSHSYEVSKSLDFVKIYNYKKSLPVKGDAVDKIKAHVASDSGKWLNDAADADGCRDMISFLWPTVSFSTPSNPISATCNFRVNLKLGPMEEQLQVNDITVVVATGCVAATYTMNFNVPASSGGVISALDSQLVPKVVIYANQTFEILNKNTILGYNFKTLSDKFKTCMLRRQALAQVMHNATECQNGFSSPLCTCVRAFTARIMSWQSRLGGKPTDTIPVGDALSKGVERCTELRRSHDVREENSAVYARSSALLVFSVALVFNAVLNVLLAYDVLGNTMWYATFFLVYFLAAVFSSLADNNGGGLSQFQTVLAMTLPAFIVHGGYCTWLNAFSFAKIPASELPFLHPVTFDLLLCSLTLFTLVERGVVQTEYLVAETLKCHVVAAVYIAVIWYHCYGRGRAALDSEFVQQAYLILYVVGLLASISSLVTPYAAKGCFELHWLLPGALTYVAFVNPGWSVNLRMAAKLNVPSDSSVYNFNSVAGFLCLLVGAVHLSVFLSEYIQIYGAKNFSWPTQGDSLAYAATRGLILPLPESLVPRNLF